MEKNLANDDGSGKKGSRGGRTRRDHVVEMSGWMHRLARKSGEFQVIMVWVRRVAKEAGLHKIRKVESVAVPETNGRWMVAPTMKKAMRKHIRQSKSACGESATSMQRLNLEQCSWGREADTICRQAVFVRD